MSIDGRHLFSFFCACFCRCDRTVNLINQRKKLFYKQGISICVDNGGMDSCGLSMFYPPLAQSPRSSKYRLTTGDSVF